MNFVFVDDTGDIGLTNTDYFGLALFHVHSDNYDAIQKLTAECRWLCNIFDEFKTKAPKYGYGKIDSILAGLASFAENNIIWSSGLFIHKDYYGGRYLKWSELGISSNEWSYYLRNYLLRHLLEYHFSRDGIPRDDMDLVLDRFPLTENSRQNTIEYLNSKPQIPLREPFNIPKILHLTNASSTYTEGLQIAHLIADIVKQNAKIIPSAEYQKLRSFVSIIGFVGHRDQTTIKRYYSG